MDEQVSIWYFGPFEGVGVGYADDSDWLGIWGRKSRSSPQMKKYLVNRIEESD
jgi:hypothetical protein